MSKEKLYNINTMTWFEFDCYLEYVKYWFERQGINYSEVEEEAKKHNVSLAEYLYTYKSDIINENKIFEKEDKFMEEIFPDQKQMQKILSPTRYNDYIEYIKGEWS